jgi:hypothetical protein
LQQKGKDAGLFLEGGTLSLYPVSLMDKEFLKLAASQDAAGGVNITVLIQHTCIGPNNCESVTPGQLLAFTPRQLLTAYAVLPTTYTLHTMLICSLAGRKTLEAASAADAIVDALEMAAHEVERQADHARQLQEKQRLEAEDMLRRRGVSAAQEAGKGKQQLQDVLPPNPLLLGLSPSAYVLRSVRSTAYPLKPQGRCP